MSFRQRLLSVRLSQDAIPSRTNRYYDEETVQHQFGGLTAKDRREDYWDATKGFGHAETQANGDIVARDPKTKEKRVLTPKEVSNVYLGGDGG
jgi:hypothetical protein